MLFYESTRLIHARPYPFLGKIFANAFLHFKPKTNWNYYLWNSSPPGSSLNDKDWTLPLYPIDHQSLPPIRKRKHLLKHSEVPYKHKSRVEDLIKDEL